MKEFTKNPACRSGAHCRACRDREGGRTFRVGLGRGFTLPQGAPDFDCPHGKAWGHDAPVPEPVPASGPGTELKKLLAKVGITATPGCACNARAAEMDRNGAEWCAAHVDLIVGWLREEAGRRGLPFADVAGRVLVRRAIKNASR